MESPLYTYGQPNGGRSFHCVDMVWRGDIQIAKCGLQPKRGWARFVSVLNQGESLCRKCERWEGEPPPPPRGAP